ncbi:hypothetical protein A9Q99_17255 [Gammaproteobacteria bacterium 45_16_T64]|nr:hypothetical protein A9Q99_17255 [Gammaproteobacteria bacterium 45_16_T64]
MTDLHFELHLPVSEPTLAIALLSDHCVLSKQQLKLAMQKGAVWVTPAGAESGAKSQRTQRVRRAKKMLKVGEEIHLYFDREILDSVALPCELIADFGGYSVWHKPNGTYSQGTKWGDHCTVARWSEQNLTPERPAFVVHRLDRATSGLILLAHSKRATKALSQMFEARLIKKRYQAMVHGRFPGELAVDRQTVNSSIDERVACSHFTPLRYLQEQDISLVDVDIETGRKHQIRRHLAELGFPIVGDRLHGIENTVASGQDLQLCAYQLHFTCPLTQEQRALELAVEKHPWFSAAS